MTLSFTNYYNKTRFDKKRRNLVSKLERRKIFYSWILDKSSDRHFSRKIHDKFRYNIAHEKTYLLKRNNSISRIVNRCIITDTPHSVNKEFRMSRMTFKESVASRYATGFTQLPVRK